MKESCEIQILVYILSVNVGIEIVEDDRNTERKDLQDSCSTIRKRILLSI